MQRAANADRSAAGIGIGACEHHGAAAERVHDGQLSRPPASIRDVAGYRQGGAVAVDRAAEGGIVDPESQVAASTGACGPGFAVSIGVSMPTVFSIALRTSTLLGLLIGGIAN